MPSGLTSSSRERLSLAGKATRNPDHADGLDPETLARFDAMEQRSNYLMLQEHFGDLRFAERRALGTAFLEIIEKVSSGPSLGRAWWTALDAMISRAARMPHEVFA